MELYSPLFAISPIDGRYSDKTSSLKEYFSEYALIKNRVFVEIEYFIQIVEKVRPFGVILSCDDKTSLRNIFSNISLQDIIEIKEIEKVTNHDVKAVEYFVKKKVEQIGLSKIKEFVHFCLTSQDINNVAIPLSIKAAHENIILPNIEEIKNKIDILSEQWYDIPMLARTHGQAATPTRVGRQFKVFSYRLEEELKIFKNVLLSAKFGGATGGFNAHIVCYRDVDWEIFANEFISSLGLKRELYTTQISNYDNMSFYFDSLKRLSVILSDFSKDVWQYISMDYFKQKINNKEVGSSAMPHKVNPIDFENAEGNLGIVVAMCNFMSEKLPISRLQRDLTDSTVLRNIGVPIAHFLISCKSLVIGIEKLLINTDRIYQDLENNIVVLSEAIQSVLRREGYNNPYEKIKDLTRISSRVTIDQLYNYIDSLDIPEDVKLELRNINVYNYIGL